MASTYQVKICIDCGKEFVLHIARKRCDECDWKHRRKPVLSIICKGCGFSFTTVKANKKYCSPFCKKEYEYKKYMEKRYGNIPN